MKRNIFYIIPLLALASCTSNDVVENTAPVYGTEEIQLNGGILTTEAIPQTRVILSTVPTGGMNISVLRQDAGAAGTLPADFTPVANEEKTAYVYDGNTVVGSSTPAIGTLCFGTSSSIGHEYYLANGKDTRLFAWYPQTKATDVTYSNGSVTFDNLNGYVDVMASKAVEGNKSTKITSILLQHMLAQLQFKAYESTAGAKDMWGKITKIEVLSVEPTCKVTLYVDKTKEPTISYSGVAKNLPILKEDGATAADPVDMAAFNTDDTTTKNAAVACGSILIPTKKAADTAMKIKVYTEKFTTGKELELKQMDYDSSSAYVVYLKFTSEEILPTVSISPWKDGGNQDVEL